MTFRLPLSVSIVLGGALTAAGQMQITLNPVDVAGDLVQAVPRGVVVKAGDGRNWTLAIGKDTRVKVKGTAVPEMLTPRTCVRFVASLTSGRARPRTKSTRSRSSRRRRESPIAR